MMVNINTPSPMLPLLSIFVWIFWGFFLTAIDLVEGQTTDAVCNSTSWTWTFNSKEQSPCLVAAYLLAPCGRGQWKVPALPPHQHYTPPTETNANDCLCSSVIYSLLSACGACQVDAPITPVNLPTTWSAWSTSCPSSMISISKYPNNISSATTVPAWAYLDVVTLDMFDPTSAIQAVSLPESTVGNNEISTTSPSLSPSQILTPASNNEPIAISAIIGITIGSTVGIGLIAALILYLLRKSKRQLPSSAFSRTRTTASMGAAAAGLRSAARHPSTLLSGGYSGWDHGQRGLPLAPAVFQFDYMSGTPWSPPPTSSTPPRAISPASAQSLLSTHNHGSRCTHSDDGMGYHNLSSGPESADLLEKPAV